MSSHQHVSVLLEQAVAAVLHKPDGIYVDGTFGRGGHSRLLLESLGPAGRLVVFDLDPQAIALAHEMAAVDARLTVVHASFAQLVEQLAALGIDRIDGLLLDLGVSSPQLDDPSRGFSFMKDGPLDMRMNNQAGLSAADWINSAEERDMMHVFFKYGEERHSRRIARAIVERRQQQPFTRTLDLASCIANAAPMNKANRHKHPATRCFQAIRIQVNQELTAVEQVLAQSLEVLAAEARLVVISFHSLEDRIVKTFMREQSQEQQIPRGLPIQGDLPSGPLRLLGKAQKAPEQELEHNPRARSAVMRVASRKP